MACAQLWAAVGGVAALLAPAVPAQTRFAVGSFYPGGPLQVYSVTQSGEISAHGSPVGLSNNVVFSQDAAGRVILTQAGVDLHLYRIAANRTLSLASSVEAEDISGTGFTQSLAISQDGRIVLALYRDAAVYPARNEFRTYRVNNRLQFTARLASFDAEPLGGIGSWSISDQGAYTAAIRLSVSSLAVLHISPSGEITDTGQRPTLPHRPTRPLDISCDGHWILTGQAAGTHGLALLSVTSNGLVSVHDTIDDPILNDFMNRLLPSLQGVAVAGLDNVVTVGLNASMEFTDVVSTDTPGIGLSQVVAVSPDGNMLLAEDQVGSHFEFFSYFVTPDGHMTPTGHSLAFPNQHTDLRFIPDPTPVTLAGDANLDGLVDSADVVFLINEALPDDKPILSPQNFANADLDQDVAVDIDDLEALIGTLLGELPL